MSPRVAEALRNVLSPRGVILGIDPGGDTGFAVVEGGKLSVARTLSLDDVYRFCARAERHVDTLVIEQFLLYPNSSLAFDPLPAPRVIGAFEVWSAMRGIPILFQSASEAKTSVTNEDVRAVFDVPKGTSRHAYDAIRHIVKHATSLLSGIDSGDQRRVS